MHEVPERTKKICYHFLMNFFKFPSLFTEDLAIDLGTANTMIYVLGKGVVVREPTICAIKKKTKEIIAIGAEAKRMLGRTPPAIVIVRPLKDGVISDYDASEKILYYFINKISGKKSSFFRLPRPRVALGVPANITEVERRAVFKAALSAGARQAFLLEEPMAAALGAELPVEEAKGSMIVDIGGGTTEIAVISLGGIVVAKSLKVAGYEIDQKVIEISKEKFGLIIGERTAEEIKIEIGNVFEPRDDKTAQLKGRSIATGLPVMIAVSQKDIYEGIKIPVSYIVEQIKDTIEETPPELVADILKSGITLSGGGALLCGLDKLLSCETKIPIRVVQDPMTSVVKGCAKALGNKKLLEKVRVT